jgi:hypothetical protein
MYALSGLDSILPPLRLFSMADGAMLVASLIPRLWLYPLDAADESVLVRLSSKAPDEFEYIVEAVDAFEGCRFVDEE